MARKSIYDMSFSKVYPLYVAKAEKKGRTKAEVDQIVFWLTGYDHLELENILNTDLDFKDFFSNAPKLNPNRKEIKGLICGIRVEEIKEELMQNIRYLDKLIDELAKGKPMDKILRR
jgi:hypothetical protein